MPIKETNVIYKFRQKYDLSNKQMENLLDTTYVTLHSWMSETRNPKQVAGVIGIYDYLMDDLKMTYNQVLDAKNTCIK